MRVKEGVLWFGPYCPSGVRRPILHAWEIIKPVMDETGENTVTSLFDGKHMATSLHYWGLAFDLRSRHLKTIDEVNSVAKLLAGELGRNYQVIVEKDHFHLEVSPLWLAANGDPRKAV